MLSESNPGKSFKKNYPGELTKLNNPGEGTGENGDYNLIIAQENCFWNNLGYETGENDNYLNLKNLITQEKM